MSRGILIFAQIGNFDYITLAEISAKRIKTFLKLPVSLVTNVDYKNEDNIFDFVIKKDSTLTQTRILNDGLEANKIEWLNFDRSCCYDLTPYDETIVIDADYIVSSDHLLNCFNLNKDFLIFNEHFYLYNNEYSKEFEFINEFGIKFYWATVFYFKKTAYSKILFSFIKFIKDNWDYYRLLYNIKERKFRNDFAFSIALSLLSLDIHSELSGFIPGKLFYCIDKDSLISINDSKLSFFILNNNSCVKTTGLDVHIMNKHSIIRYSDE